ncbi:MAG: rhomboid family intramembrane serine protease [Desulfarculaceae bacterium]|nr:rhomboid family intramembrane serine protease [Desulfarculaceae bacterium]MCF8046520.1 rhomboid family intramembrane serine protease [Desulfarculaceae bacterium]MCF8064681.1 rhomboid family intramembrane serine protease [Desulfarculaceae bacterium]MCF8096199.1 rhomboid family intramembrane serine protease [Desulfarculaceae bacterium]MCF8123432.1 rhomboid family intramembrane serine protease [Desulfarculaceae bacterium]
MIPIRDENPIQGTPYVTLGIIALNVLVYLYQLVLPAQRELVFVYQYGVVPALLTGSVAVPEPLAWLPQPLTLVTSVFLHGGFFHLAGNMLYLWIFGNNIEDRLGPVRFVAFYLLGGVLASLAHVLAGPASQLPMIGASGAIAAVLGAYFLLYPRANVVVLIWFFFFVQLIRVPAVIVLGVWFLFQVLGSGGPGVAWMAHIGGFVVGLVLIRFFLPSGSRPRGRGPSIFS